ncbi:MAG TPA: hypothetical protein VK601_13675 [Kofleriaceae bacterium]|nr:hypothetical protein [Kofleriaceae bacterium]
MSHVLAGTRSVRISDIIALRDASASPTRSRGLCDKAREPEIEAFFKARIEAFEGGPRIYQQELEQLELLCDARKRARTPSVEAFLKTQ